ncbi:MAG: NADH:ubiquinone reductase (Na(+)-transporting) subunit C [Rikenellaceae bacterium]|nr:NADH:ubiquinone reductase (Na(+)-transporting) subunit C [Rikenellaceae bacterium]
MGKINVNSNAYIITYSVVMVVIVAILLAVAALSLKPYQDANALNEKQTQIVKALGENPETAKYEDVIAKASIIDAEGNVIKTEEKAVFEALGKLKDSFAKGEFPLFEAKNGCVVIPLTGNGLWGPIWGYVALEQDKNTIKGVVMDHQGETPGLGAEIASDAHQAQYVGKQIFVDGELTGIIVKKGGATVGSVNEVDAISGGTKTCDGVTDMFKNSLANYVGYLKPAAAPINVEEPVELIPVTEEVKVEAVEVSNDKIEQSNE